MSLFNSEAGVSFDRFVMSNCFSNQFVKQPKAHHLQLSPTS
jgi:hypothetical protein